MLISVRGAKTEQVLSSRYCRCLDTAGYAFDDRKPEIFAALDPLPADPASPRPSRSEIVARVKSFSGSGNLIMVTHQDVIQALTGVSAHEGEAVIVGPTATSFACSARFSSTERQRSVRD